MFDVASLLYCRDGEHYYDAPSKSDMDDDFRLAVPPGWTRESDREWVRFLPPGVVLPDQGWKVHVSATPDNCARVLNLVADFCQAERLLFKFLRSVTVLRQRNSKYGDRSASGKFITIFPEDIDGLTHVLTILGERLDGEPGPRILSDLRWRNGPLYVRYGGFRLIPALGPGGQIVPGLRDPDGNTVPDVRKPGFYLPPWVTLPEVLQPALAARNAGTITNFPYQVTKALHFSNGGGVYLGTDKQTGEVVLLKEARPLAGLDGASRDAVARLQAEHWALQRLAGLDFVPGVRDFRLGHEHYFLVRDFVDGIPLTQAIAERNPLLAGDRVDDTAAAGAYARWAMAVFERVEECLTAMHQRGVAFNDLHTNNIIVAPDGSISVIDLEAATPIDEEPSGALGAPGFTAPAGLSRAESDRYALACVGLALFVPLTIVTAWGPEKINDLLSLVAGTFPGTGPLLERVRGYLSDAGRERLPVASPLWPAGGASRMRPAIVRAIAASATPSRPDRLFPGDIAQFRLPSGGLGFGYGAAGVLWALAHTGAAVAPEHLRWLLDAVDRTVSQPDSFAGVRPGFADGLSGIAYALDGLGHTELAMRLARDLADAPWPAADLSLWTGLAGVGLTLLHLAQRHDDADLAAAAERVAKLLLDRADWPTPRRPGLLHGLTGAALFLVRYDSLCGGGDPSVLAHAAAAVAKDAAGFGWPDRPGTWSALHGLAGPIGTAVVARELCARRPDADLERAAAAFAKAARARFIGSAGWLDGRAGTMLGLRLLARDEADHAVLRRHADDLGWHAVRRDGDGRAFLGAHGLRLSTDLATGSAGVLLAIRAAEPDPPEVTGVPLLGASRPGKSS